MNGKRLTAHQERTYAQWSADYESGPGRTDPARCGSPGSCCGCCRARAA